MLGTGLPHFGRGARLFRADREDRARRGGAFVEPAAGGRRNSVTELFWARPGRSTDGRAPRRRPAAGRSRGDAARSRGDGQADARLRASVAQGAEARLSAGGSGRAPGAFAVWVRRLPWGLL